MQVTFSGILHYDRRLIRWIELVVKADSQAFVECYADLWQLSVVANIFATTNQRPSHLGLDRADDIL